jgi:AcrR family transcriptional regulator
LDLLSTAALNRSERRRKETADRIAHAAARLFGERGLTATTVSDICERADVARQTFFNHFSTKQDLVEELARRGHDFYREALETARREGASTGERLARFFEQIHESTSTLGPMHRDLLAEVVRAVHSERDPARMGSLGHALEKLLREGRAQGDVSRRHALEDQAALVMGAQQHLVFQWMHRSDFPIAERFARLARVLAELLAPTEEERKKSGRIARVR